MSKGLPSERNSSPLLFQSLPNPTNASERIFKADIHEDSLALNSPRSNLSQILNSPKSNLTLEQSFDEKLKSIYFFKKPDIIPFPYLNFDQAEDQAQAEVKKNTGISDLESERSLRRALETENQELKARLSHFLEVEGKLKDYQSNSVKSADLESKIDQLNSRIQLILEENENLKRVVSKKHGQCIKFKQLKHDFEAQARKNSDLLASLKEFKDSYEDLRRTYAKDIQYHKSKFEKLFDEKLELELIIADYRDKYEHPKKEFLRKSGSESSASQHKLQENKHVNRHNSEIADKLTKPERLEDASDIRLREIEERLENLQEKLTLQASQNEKILGGRPKESTPFTSSRSLKSIRSHN